MTTLFERAPGNEWSDLHSVIRERHDLIFEYYELFGLGENRVTNATSHVLNRVPLAGTRG